MAMEAVGKIKAAESEAQNILADAKLEAKNQIDKEINNAKLEAKNKQDEAKAKAEEFIKAYLDENAKVLADTKLKAESKKQEAILGVIDLLF